MIKKNLFHKTKASDSDFRILADEELYIVNGGTGSLESEGTEATPEVQCDASNPGTDEDKLAELASQAVASTEASAESAPTSEATTIDAQINAIQSSAGSNTNEAQTNAADSVLNSYTEGITDRNQSGDSTVSIDMGTQANQAVKLEMTDMRESALGLAESEPTTLDVTGRTSATASLKVIDNALQRALNQEASIGEIMNRLEFTSSNLTTASENLQSADSTYRDADMAKEMTQLTKNNILNQAATAMLSQANQQNQGVLQMLQ